MLGENRESILESCNTAIAKVTVLALSQLRIDGEIDQDEPVFATALFDTNGTKAILKGVITTRTGITEFETKSSKQIARVRKDRRPASYLLQSQEMCAEWIEFLKETVT